MDQLLEIPSPAAIRQKLIEKVFNDLLGPAGGPEEEIDEDKAKVRDRYLVGMLAPRGWRAVPEEQDELAVGGAGTEQDDAGEINALQAPTFFPSSCGMTFCIDGESESLKITARWGRYSKVESKTAFHDKTGAPKQLWKREPVESIWENVPLRPGNVGPLGVRTEYGEVVVKGVARKPHGQWIVSLFLVNGQNAPKSREDSAWLFQPELVVEGIDGAPIFRNWLESTVSLEDHSSREEQAMSMLYRNRVEFAVGHGVSVHVEKAADDPRLAVGLSTTFIPSYEVPQQTPPTEHDIPDMAGLVLDMKELAETKTSDFVDKLRALPNSYAAWLKEQSERVQGPKEGLSRHIKTAQDALDCCETALERIEDGIHLVGTNEQAAEAFRFANKAMWLQRIRCIYAERFRRNQAPSVDEIDTPDNRSWYPFQLAFVLLNLPGLTDLHHSDRTGDLDAVADLLWFPTGGGKTESYLGLAAYAMGIRRLQGTVSGRSGMSGVAVLMRYTLRLLTLQQFQRASALICACEVIRRDAVAAGIGKWGEEPFRIGLWVGQRTTPNRTDYSAEAVKQGRGHYRRGGPAAGSGSPAQLTHCPWCGSPINPGKNIKVETFRQGRGRTFIYCSDKSFQCPFTENHSNGEGIPVLVVDEEIYRRLPALLIATVDKFAQMPWKGETQMLFGRVNGFCERHGFRSPEIEDTDSHPAKGTLRSAKTVECSPRRPPDLVIQDELHLISGPLGTLVGLYETTVDELCSWEVDGKRVRPKIIASTATIRRAGDQVHSLFLRKLSVFPPHGLDVEDNFFSVQREPGDECPGRRYLGICAPGKRVKVALIRVYVALLSAAQALFSQYGEHVDPWMTLAGYFNSLRELGGMRRVVDDTVASLLKQMDRRGLAKRQPPQVAELTSRQGSADIPIILDLLEVPFEPRPNNASRLRNTGGDKTRPPRPLDVLMATSMISVGVDVQRLGLMVVAGQPKSTAEYIQATSRVGRKKPGLVVTVYNWARPRDMSHYETFEHYHATFYKHVEALSVTPYSARAIDRGLTAQLVSLARLADEDFNANETAGLLEGQHPLVHRALEAIATRAEHISGSKKTGDDVKDQLKSRLDSWLDAAQRAKATGAGNLAYQRRRPGMATPLLKKPGPGSWETFTCLNSLREVEPTVGLILDNRGLDDDPDVT